MAPETFDDLLTRQVGHEFAASHQYIAVAVWFDSQDLPQLARHFYRQSLEERNHAMMIVQYILDRDLPLTIPGVGEVRNDFTDVREPLALALSQEQEVTEQIKALFAAARAEGDALGEQFMLWFLKEQVEEVASMTTLVNVARGPRTSSTWRTSWPGSTSATAGTVTTRGRRRPPAEPPDQAAVPVTRPGRRVTGTRGRCGQSVARVRSAS